MKKLEKNILIINSLNYENLKPDLFKGLPQLTKKISQYTGIMKTKNRYRKKARLDNCKTREIIKCFSMDLTATKTAEITNLNIKTIDDWYNYIRKVIYTVSEAEKQEKV